MHWRAVFKTVEAQIFLREYFGQHDDLTSVHRIGKRNMNRFPIFCLQTR
jgi:hypothetical protein